MVLVLSCDCGQLHAESGGSAVRTLLRKLYLHVWVLPRSHTHKRYRKLDPVEVFRDVYATKRWGSHDEQYFSGSGSGGPAAEEYCRVIREFVRARAITTIADL